MIYVMIVIVKNSNNHVVPASKIDYNTASCFLDLIMELIERKEALSVKKTT